MNFACQSVVPFNSTRKTMTQAYTETQGLQKNMHVDYNAESRLFRRIKGLQPSVTVMVIKCPRHINSSIMPYSSAGYEKQEGGLASGINIYSSLLCTPIDVGPKKIDEINCVFYQDTNGEKVILLCGGE